MQGVFVRPTVSRVLKMSLISCKVAEYILNIKLLVLHRDASAVLLFQPLAPSPLITIWQSVNLSAASATIQLGHQSESPVCLPYYASPRRKTRLPVHCDRACIHSDLRRLARSCDEQRKNMCPGIPKSAAVCDSYAGSAAVYRWSECRRNTSRIHGYSCASPYVK